MLDDVKPTRMELIETKKRAKLAEEGHDLLNQKRDALMVELRELLKDVKGIRKDLDKKMVSAFKSLAIAEAVDGSIEVMSASFAVQQAPEVSVSSKNIMGLKVPTLKGEEAEEKGLLTRGYGILGTSSRMDKAANNFEIALNMVLKLAESEEALKRLVNEIQSTQRRVNALEFSIIPKLKEIVKTITMKLDELEREDFFRLKKIKSK